MTESSNNNDLTIASDGRKCFNFTNIVLHFSTASEWLVTITCTDTLLVITSYLCYVNFEFYFSFMTIRLQR